MDKILFWAVLVFTALPIVLGALLGLKRGLNRSLLRLVIVGASILAAWLLRDTLTDTIMNLQIGGQSIKQAFEAQFAENPEMLKLVLPIVEIIIGVITFLLTFLLLKLVSLIVFWLLCIVVRPGKLKNRMLGLAVGAVQGILVAYFICVPLTGLADTVDKAAQIDLSGMTTSSANASGSLSISEVYAESAFGLKIKGVSIGKSGDVTDGNPVEDDKAAGSDASSSSESLIPDELKPIIEVFAAYKKTALYKIYSGVEFGTYKSLTTVKDEAGKNVTLDVQIDAVVALSKMAKSAQQLKDIDFSAEGGMNEESVGNLKEVLNNIEEVKKELSAEVKESISNIVSVVSESFDLPVDISKIDLEKVDFSKAGDAIEKAYLLQKSKEDGEIEEIKASEVLEIFTESNLVVPAADMGIDVSSMLSEADKTEFKEAIADFEKDGKIDEETKAALEKILGISAEK